MASACSICTGVPGDAHYGSLIPDPTYIHTYIHTYIYIYTHTHPLQESLQQRNDTLDSKGAGTCPLRFSGHPSAEPGSPNKENTHFWFRVLFRGFRE